MRVIVAGWAGSSNLGDELVLVGMLELLRASGHTPVVLSVNPDDTQAVHGVEAVSPSRLPALRADALVFGGGGLLQDETSPLNLPYHLARVWAARARRLPVVGLGLGVGRLDTRLGRTLVHRTFARTPLAVRDEPSARLLTSLGLPQPVVTADLAFGLPPTEVAPLDRVVVCLRPWGASGGVSALLPASRRRPSEDADGVRATAAQLDDVFAATGLPCHLVALQADRDGPLHDQVATQMRTPVTTARPDLAGLRAEVGASRAVLAMRFHGTVCAVLAGRPAVLVGYSPKVDALAADLGPAGVLRPWTPRPTGWAQAVLQVLGQDSSPAREALRARSVGNADVLARLTG